MRIDLNSDLGEHFGRWELGDDTALLSIVTSANVACGFHAGDPSTLRRTTREAAERGVAIGGHVSYRDLVGFGRRFVDVPPVELTDEVLYQLGALSAFTSLAGQRIRYVKPHGALYNAIVRNEEQATAVVEAVYAFDPDLPVLGLPGSRFLERAEEVGMRTYREAFADRAYTPEGTLVSRREPGSVLHDPEEIATRCLRIARGEPITAIDGTEILVEADSLCVHGDSPGAVGIARAVAARLRLEGVTLAPFTGT
ncbi:LamB/YcsF family protein [Nocardiopsis alkaliphila]|uniref:LamB/YcsF family protein n=1 Tax=Nocardiopsis alkaliphila TaxID=225762 RepID=UPI00034D0394|nr:5-oxoprolinase subunit PxpA [Nocardiopsis alkaliphila]